MKLDRDEIIKAVEHCGAGILDCDECPCDRFNLGSTRECMEALMRYASLAFKELTEENKKHSEKIVQLISQVDCDKAEITLLRNHIESLGATIEMQEQEVYSIKADTVRKMQERLHEKTFELNDVNEDIFLAVEVADIDQIAKELIEKPTE